MKTLGLFIIYHVSFIFVNAIDDEFTPNRTDYDAYGVKVAINEHFLVLARNGKEPPNFFIQMAPYNDTPVSSQCSILYPDSDTHFVYAVALGKAQAIDQFHFYFIGELLNGIGHVFFGVAILNSTALNYHRNISHQNISLPCQNHLEYQIQYISNYSHQEHLILGVEPRGRWAYLFSNKFVAMYDYFNSSLLTIWNGTNIWPSSTFIPYAVDITENYAVISGFVFNGKDSYTKHSPLVYLLNFDPQTRTPFFVNQYKPLPTPGTWQDLLTNADANIYLPKYDMSVSINQNGFVLVGMQFINRVFLLSVNQSKPTKLNYVSRHTNGRTLGNGKSIAWLDNGIAALIVNVYTLDYQWISSQLHVYGVEYDGYNSSTTPLSFFPSNHQKLPFRLDPVFLTIASSPSSLVLLDSRGNLLIFNPVPAGFYLIIDTTRNMPITTLSQPCMPGTFKNLSGIHDCTLCPSGTRNPGNHSTMCIPCSSNTFCPLASVNEVPEDSLKPIIQARAYPKSPESVIFDEILIQNMFSIESGRCVYVSPLFWTLIAASFSSIILLFMGVLKYLIKNPQCRRFRASLKCFFRHTDLIGEGEFWVGGLASFPVVVLVTFACVFSQNYVKQYPIETSSDSYFACDLSLRNAKFQTSVQSLAIPLSDADHMMFDLLDKQEFFLNVHFINTLINCDAVSIEALFGLTWSTIRWLDCQNINSTLFLSIPLPYQHISVQIYVADPKTIGALKIGLLGQSKQNGSYILRELNFYQPFYKNGYILARTLPISLSLTKVINETLAMDGGQSIFSGIYIPTFTVDHNSVFSNADQFVRSTLTLTTLAIALTETPFYVKNLQQPIAKPSEIVFQNLLFITVCLELFGLLFLSYKLLFKPFYHTFLKKNSSKTSIKKESVDEKQKRLTDSSKSRAQLVLNDISYF